MVVIIIEIGVILCEIYVILCDLVCIMNEVLVVFEQILVLVGSGQVGLICMGDIMQNVMDVVGLVSVKLVIFNEKVGNINQVVIIIIKVVDQINLLLLNVVIEVEKVGEYGCGFLVVVIEICCLVDQIVVVIYDIEVMVKEIQLVVVVGVMGMDKFFDQVWCGMQDVQIVGSQLLQIIVQVQVFVLCFQIVNEGMQVQVSSVEQINQVLVQFFEVVQQIVELLQ